MALFRLSFTSKYLAGPADVNVIMPDPAFGKEPSEFYGSGKKYKVLWLLHGTWGDYTDWIRKSNAELYACEKQMVVVMPSALNSNYVDWNTFGMGHHVYSFFLKELMPLIYGWFPVSDKREDNFIAGLSMGGRGACVFAFNHPGLFAGMYSFSASPKRLQMPDPNNQFSAREFNLINNFGDFDGYLNSPLNLLRVLEEKREEGVKLPELYFACGDRDPIGYQDFLTFHTYAEKHRLKADFFEVPGYSHEWRFWDLCLQDALERFAPSAGKVPVFNQYRKV